MTVTTPMPAEGQPTPANDVPVNAATGAPAAPAVQNAKVLPTKPVAKKATPAKRPALAKAIVPRAGAVAAPKPAAKANVRPLQAAVAPKLDKPVKPKKLKMIRDSFTMPKDEIAVIDDLKLRALKLAYPIKKSELIRAGFKALALMSDTTFLAAMKAVPTIKTGRPSK